MYVLNNIGGKFEFLGKLEDIISKGVFGGKWYGKENCFI
jgi:hypothetical protein